ncbi:MAG: thioredoxin family protein [Clostridiaceae bacterium]|jgi:glutaredoxin 3|nr:thioredoxin family protein [Clostridiaceae bacterium]
MNKIEIYTSATCPYCIKAKKLLQLLNLEYEEHNVDNDFEKMQKMLKERFNLSVETIPQIIINGTYVGGFTDLEALYKSGGLNKILN